MCGIGGFSLSGKSKLNSRKVANVMLTLLEQRGNQASGVAWHSKSGVGFSKSDVAGSRLNLKFLPHKTDAVILHTRLATHGSVKDNRNNHPVMSPNSKIALVHNGVIYNHDMVRKELPKTLPPVDTAVIPALLQIESLGGISKLDGDAAIAWIAGDDYGVLKIARVSHSPLAIAQSKDGSFFFASTESILDQALAKLGIKPAFKMALSEREGYSIRKGRIVETLSIPQLDPSYEMPVTKSAYSSYRHMTSGASMWSDWDEYPSPASEDSDSPYRTQYEDDFEIFLSNYIEYNTNEFFSYDGYYAGTKEDLWYEFEKVRYEMSDYKEDYATWWRQNA